MKKNSRQVPATPPTLPSFSALQAERQARQQLHQLYVQQPELCLEVIRRWLASSPQPTASSALSSGAPRSTSKP
jgi:hypothetical protein